MTKSSKYAWLYRKRDISLPEMAEKVCSTAGSGLVTVMRRVSRLFCFDFNILLCKARLNTNLANWSSFGNEYPTKWISVALETARKTLRHVFFKKSYPSKDFAETGGTITG